MADTWAGQCRAREIARHQHHIFINGIMTGWIDATARIRAVYRLAGDAAVAATRLSAGVAAILTSTSLTGFSVQAWVT